MTRIRTGRDPLKPPHVEKTFNHHLTEEDLEPASIWLQPSSLTHEFTKRFLRLFDGLIFTPSPTQTDPMATPKRRKIEGQEAPAQRTHLTHIQTSNARGTGLEASTDEEQP